MNYEATYDEIKRKIAPDIDSLKGNSSSFTNDGTTVVTTAPFGDVKCTQYTAVFSYGGQTQYTIHYYITDSGVLVKVEGIMSNGLSQYCNTIDKSTMVMVPGTGS